MTENFQVTFFVPIISIMEARMEVIAFVNDVIATIKKTEKTKL